MKKEKIGYIDVGGGTRGIYGAGVLDYCMDKGIVFDRMIGVSAGSANCASYLSGQRGRNFRFYDEYAFRKEYMSMRNYRRTHSYIDLDYIYSTLSNSYGENPMDYDAMMAHPADFDIVATNAVTGRPVYFRKRNILRDHYDFFKASSCVPVVNRPYPIGTGLYFDGGISDPVPIRRAFERGCDRVVLVLTRPRSYARKSRKDKLFARSLYHEFPRAASAMANRASTYNRQMQIAMRLEQKGRVLIIAPDSIGKLKTLSQDHRQLELLYEKGYEDAKAIEAFLG
ncbi:MAG: patatin family protein [Lachnospiraceae bacterium]|nr:patatin family protein [Lachnospiraceae bacterium]